MEQNSPSKKTTTITEITSGLKVVESEYTVKVPVFEDIIIQRPIFQDIEIKSPKFIDEQIKIPSGFDEVINSLALSISEKVFSKIEAILNERLSKAIDERLTEIKYPKLIEELKITEIPVTIERFNYVDKEIINPVLKNVTVENAVITDKPVLNAIITDVRVNNCIIKEVEVINAVIREKVIEVVHKSCYDDKGNSLI